LLVSAELYRRVAALACACAAGDEEAVRDTTLLRGGGEDGTQPIFVAKGTEIVYHFHLMHRDREYWGEDADVWRLERWETRRPGKEHAPFNAGPR